MVRPFQRYSILGGAHSTNCRAEGGRDDLGSTFLHVLYSNSYSRKSRPTFDTVSKKTGTENRLSLSRVYKKYCFLRSQSLSEFGKYDGNVNEDVYSSTIKFYSETKATMNRQFAC
jgi:hypothetical protein